MKKTFWAVAVLLGAAVCVSSCTDEDYEEQLYEGTAVASHGGGGTVEKIATKGSVGAAQPVSHDLRTHVVAGTVGAAQPVSHDLRTHVVATRTRAEVDHIGAFTSNMQKVSAINAFMKICGPDINGGSSSFATKGAVGAAQPVSHDLRTHVVAGTVGAAQPVSHDLRTHVVAGTVGAAQPVSHDLRTHVVATKGAVGAAQPVSHDLRTHVVAARTRADVDHIGAFNTYMKICGPDINGGSSSKGYTDVAKPAFHRTLVAAAGKDLNDGKADDVAK